MSPQMNDNQIDNWADLDELKNAKSLETVYLERNPLQKDPQYRRKIMLALPTVRQIDATFIRFWAAVYSSPDSFSIRLGKKKKTLCHFKMLAELCRHSIQKHSNMKRTCGSLYLHVCTYALTPWSEAVAKKLHYLIDLIGAVNMARDLTLVFLYSEFIFPGSACGMQYEADVSSLRSRGHEETVALC